MQRNIAASMRSLMGHKRTNHHGPKFTVVRCCEGFRMPAADGGRGKHGRPASENLQWRKSREGIRRQRGVRYRELSGGLNCKLGAGLFSNDVGLEWVYNFGVMARVLLNGESRCLSSCDFKELGVIKRARFTTLTLAASQHSLNSITRTDR